MVGMFIGLLLLAFMLYVSYYDINKEAEEEDFIVKDDLKDKEQE